MLWSWLLGCASLDRDDACALAQEWIEGHAILLEDGGQATDVQVLFCSDFRSDVSAGWAEVDPHVEIPTGDDPQRAVVRCALVRFDQGWEVEICTERFDGIKLP